MGEKLELKLFLFICCCKKKLLIVCLEASSTYLAKICTAVRIWGVDSILFGTLNKLILSEYITHLFSVEFRSRSKTLSVLLQIKENGGRYLGFSRTELVYHNRKRRSSGRDDANKKQRKVDGSNLENVSNEKNEDDEDGDMNCENINLSGLNEFTSAQNQHSKVLSNRRESSASDHVLKVKTRESNENLETTYKSPKRTINTDVERSTKKMRSIEQNYEMKSYKQSFKAANSTKNCSATEKESVDLSVVISSKSKNSSTAMSNTNGDLLVSLPSMRRASPMSLPSTSGSPRVSLPSTRGGPRVSLPSTSRGPRPSLPSTSRGPQLSLTSTRGGPRVSLPSTSREPRSSLPYTSRGPQPSLPYTSRGPQLSLPSTSRGLRLSLPFTGRGPRLSFTFTSRGARLSLSFTSGGPQLPLPFTSTGPWLPLPCTSRGPQLSSPSTSRAPPVSLPSTSRAPPVSLPSTRRSPPVSLPSTSRPKSRFLLHHSHFYEAAMGIRKFRKNRPEVESLTIITLEGHSSEPITHKTAENQSKEKISRYRKSLKLNKSKGREKKSLDYRCWRRCISLLNDEDEAYRKRSRNACRQIVSSWFKTYARLYGLKPENPRIRTSKTPTNQTSSSTDVSPLLKSSTNWNDFKKARRRNNRKANPKNAAINSKDGSGKNPNERSPNSNFAIIRNEISKFFAIAIPTAMLEEMCITINNMQTQFIGWRLIEVHGLYPLISGKSLISGRNFKRIGSDNPPPLAHYNRTHNHPYLFYLTRHSASEIDDTNVLYRMLMVPRDKKFRRYNQTRIILNVQQNVCFYADAFIRTLSRPLLLDNLRNKRILICIATNDTSLLGNSIDRLFQPLYRGLAHKRLQSKDNLSFLKLASGSTPTCRPIYNKVNSAYLRHREKILRKRSKKDINLANPRYEISEKELAQIYEGIDDARRNESENSEDPPDCMRVRDKQPVRSRRFALVPSLENGMMKLAVYDEPYNIIDHSSEFVKRTPLCSSPTRARVPMFLITFDEISDTFNVYNRCFKHSPILHDDDIDYSSMLLNTSSDEDSQDSLNKSKSVSSPEKSRKARKFFHYLVKRDENLPQNFEDDNSNEGDVLLNRSKTLNHCQYELEMIYSLLSDGHKFKFEDHSRDHTNYHFNPELIRSKDTISNELNDEDVDVCGEVDVPEIFELRKMKTLNFKIVTCRSNTYLFFLRAASEKPIFLVIIPYDASEVQIFLRRRILIEMPLEIMKSLEKREKWKRSDSDTDFTDDDADVRSNIEVLPRGDHDDPLKTDESDREMAAERKLDRFKNHTPIKSNCPNIPSSRITYRNCAKRSFITKGVDRGSDIRISFWEDTEFEGFLANCRGHTVWSYELSCGSAPNPQKPRFSVAYNSVERTTNFIIGNTMALSGYKEENPTPKAENAPSNEGNR